MSEVACLKWETTVLTPLLDLEKFYDSIDNVKLMHQAVQFKWNPVGLFISLLVHMAQRVLRIGDLWGEWRSPCKSILQGCGSSILGPESCCTICCKTCTPVSLFRLVTTIVKGTFFQALHWSVEATCMLDMGLTSLGLTLSQHKSMIVASHPQLLRAVRLELLEQGISFEGADSVRDVGLDATAWHRRSVKIQNKREQKCRKRNAHIKGNTERIEDQAPGKKAVQDWDSASDVQRACCDGHVPELYPT